VELGGFEPPTSWGAISESRAAPPFVESVICRAFTTGTTAIHSSRSAGIRGISGDSGTSRQGSARFRPPFPTARSYGWTCGAICRDRSAAKIHPATKTNPAEMPKTQVRSPETSAMRGAGWAKLPVRLIARAEF
jgi:hypothetical protein